MIAPRSLRLKQTRPGQLRQRRTSESGRLRTVGNWSCFLSTVLSLILFYGGAIGCEDGTLDPGQLEEVDYPTPELGTIRAEVMGGIVAETSFLFLPEGENWRAGIPGGDLQSVASQYPNIASVMRTYESGDYPYLRRAVDGDFLADASSVSLHAVDNSSEATAKGLIFALEPRMENRLEKALELAAELREETPEPWQIGLDEIEPLYCLLTEMRPMFESYGVEGNYGLLDPVLDLVERLPGTPSCEPENNLAGIVIDYQRLIDDTAAKNRQAIAEGVEIQPAGTARDTDSKSSSPRFLTGSAGEASAPRAAIGLAVGTVVTLIVYLAAFIIIVEVVGRLLFGVSPVKEFRDRVWSHGYGFCVQQLDHRIGMDEARAGCSCVFLWHCPIIGRVVDFVADSVRALWERLRNTDYQGSAEYAGDAFDSVGGAIETLNGAANSQ